MTTAANAERWRHSRHLAQPALYLFFTASATEPWMPTPPRWIAATVTLLLFAALYANLKHDGELCERCIAHMPLDPQTAVDKHRKQLRTHHRLSRVFAAGLTLTVIGDVLPQHWIAAKALASSSTVVFLGLFYVIAVHNRLQPWCPFCPRDEGDDDTVDVPDPVDGNRKPIPA